MQERWAAPDVEYALPTQAKTDELIMPHPGQDQAKTDKMLSLEARAGENIGEATKKTAAADQVHFRGLSGC